MRRVVAQTRSPRADASADRALEDAFVDALVGWARGLEASKPGAARAKSTRALMAATAVYATRFSRFAAEVIGLEQGIAAGMPVADIFAELIDHKRRSPRGRDARHGRDARDAKANAKAPAARPRPARRGSLERELARLLSDHLGCEPQDVTPEATLRSLGARQKIDLFQVAVAIETALGVAISDHEVAKLRTVRDLVEHVRAAGR